MVRSLSILSHAIEEEIKRVARLAFKEGATHKHARHGLPPYKVDDLRAEEEAFNRWWEENQS